MTTPPRAATVEFRHVTKAYGVRPRDRQTEAVHGAVNDLSLTVPAGRICILVGPSGCGKTTTLKMVNRLIDPTSGQILIDGVDVMAEEVTALRRRIGYVIQQVGLFPHLTIGENVAVVPRLLGWEERRRRERTDELLGLVGLDPVRYRDRYPAQLSGGERQRVGVARALAVDPPVMLMDEPFGAVDPIVRDRLQNEFLRLQDDLAKTILFVTHDIDEAIKMGDLVAVMEQGGRLAQFAPPDEILANPASDFVARFVGADRGLKRLALARVRDLELQPMATARDGEDADAARARAVDSGVPVPPPRGRRGPTDGLDRRFARFPPGVAYRRGTGHRLGRSWSPRRPSATRCPCCSPTRCRRASWSTDSGSRLGLITVETIGMALPAGHAQAAAS